MSLWDITVDGAVIGVILYTFIFIHIWHGLIISGIIGLILATILDYYRTKQYIKDLEDLDW